MVNKQAKHEQNQERIRQLVKDIEQQPNDTTSYLELSALLLEQKAFTEAIELLQKAHAWWQNRSYWTLIWPWPITMMANMTRH
ncbi:hypothetical protein [Amylolactobacillus amylophilus]|uniref:hypothetical protein n=1 Tax=Amylolactobacillus amylophilus TaxID=1603 RepID=UPI0006D0BAA4|nr:hypothetical protein [Amylolactobacillus amylophilus]